MKLSEQTTSTLRIRKAVKPGVPHSEAIGPVRATLQGEPFVYGLEVQPVGKILDISIEVLSSDVPRVVEILREYF